MRVAERLHRRDRMSFGDRFAANGGNHRAALVAISFVPIFITQLVSRHIDSDRHQLIVIPIVSLVTALLAYGAYFGIRNQMRR